MSMVAVYVPLAAVSHDVPQILDDGAGSVHPAMVKLKPPMATHPPTGSEMPNTISMGSLRSPLRFVKSRVTSMEVGVPSAFTVRGSPKLE